MRKTIHFEPNYLNDMNDANTLQNLTTSNILSTLLAPTKTRSPAGLVPTWPTPPAPSGGADTLARAKNTSVQGVIDAGIAASRDGNVRLLERGELDETWDPATDTRLTVWEATKHLKAADMCKGLLLGTLKGTGIWLAVEGPGSAQDFVRSFARKKALARINNIPGSG